MKKILVVFILFSNSAFSQGKLIIQNDLMSIYEYKDSFYYWHYSKLNVSPYSEEVIFRNKLKERKTDPIYFLKDSTLAIVFRIESVINYHSWKYNPKYTRVAKTWREENYEQVFKKWQLNWSILDGARLYSNYEGNAAENYGFIDINTPFLLKYNEKKRWVEVFHFEGKKGEPCSHSSAENCIKTDVIEMKPLTLMQIMQKAKENIKKAKSKKSEE